MTPLATRQQPRYTTPQSGKGRYGYQLIKNPRVSGFSQIVLFAGEVALAGNIAKPHIECGLFNFAMCLSVANLGSGRKFEFGLSEVNHCYTIEQVC